MEPKYFTIGQVVERLQPSFPDLSISKVRYLEEEGLISPKRTKSGYRKFSASDVKQLEAILKLQKEQFLPLAVIKEKMKVADVRSMGPERQRADTKESLLSITKEAKRFTHEDLLQKTGLTEAEVKSLEVYSLLEPEETDQGRSYSEADIRLAGLAKKFAATGIEPRHLRMYEAFADKEAQLLWQILVPALKRSKVDKHHRVLGQLSDLLNQSQELKEILLKRALSHYFGNL